MYLQFGDVYVKSWSTFQHHGKRSYFRKAPPGKLGADMSWSWLSSSFHCCSLLWNDLGARKFGKPMIKITRRMGFECYWLWGYSFFSCFSWFDEGLGGSRRIIWFLRPILHDCMVMLYENHQFWIGIHQVHRQSSDKTYSEGEDVGGFPGIPRYFPASKRWPPWGYPLVLSGVIKNGQLGDLVSWGFQ